MAFWMLSGVAAALAAWILLTFARRGEDIPVGVPDPQHELDELERLCARGLMSDEAHAVAHAEAARRLLRETPVGEAPLRPRPRDRLWAAGTAAATAAAALGLYLVLGAPGYPDRPHAVRVAQWAQMPELLEPDQLAAVMTAAVAERPTDPEAQAMLGAARFAAGDPLGAASAFRRVVILQPDNAQAWARLGESLVRAAKGTVGGDAEAAFLEAIRLDPQQGGARYYLGELALQRGDLDDAHAMWGPLIDVLSPSDPRRADLIARLEVAS
ncbi:c-type cytochrome biogenesis protein CcmI [Brevundimonas sp.]|uniref:c-type cytochrome biogenesis protein CcmI n=1 Tax=Brevundimonas sp. TaxID=1871086 RepID=UPI0022CA9164|nr:c-type cytochrome biogenesis protein CcmI [Brevundimonas sp.]MCZ8194052.1 c-type cytochrome biogenesis protein CcmI [Brevundimonas sp.]